MKIILKILTRYRFIIIALLVLGLFGYTLIRMQAVSTPQADQAYLEEKRGEIKAEQIKIDNDLRMQIESLKETPINIDLENIGKSDPFSP